MPDRIETEFPGVLPYPEVSPYISPTICRSPPMCQAAAVIAAHLLCQSLDLCIGELTGQPVYRPCHHHTFHSTPDSKAAPDNPEFLDVYLAEFEDVLIKVEDSS